MRKTFKDKIIYMLSYEYSSSGKMQFIIGFILGFLFDILMVLTIIIACLILDYLLLVAGMRFSLR